MVSCDNEEIAWNVKKALLEIVWTMYWHPPWNGSRIV